jgi:arylsulfatase A-like enzyme
MHRGNSTNSPLTDVLKHLLYVSIVFSAIASISDIIGIALVNHELGDLIDMLRLFVGIAIITFLPYLIYLAIIRLLLNLLSRPSPLSKRFSSSIFYCLGLLPIDFLVARDLSVYSALSLNPDSQVKFFTLRPDLLIIVIVLSLIVGTASGIGTTLKRPSGTVKRPLPSRIVIFTAIPLALMAILYLPPLLHGPSTIGTPPSNAPLTGRSANVILISIDTMRTDELGCYGSQGAKTPNIDRIAGESMVFDNAVTALPMTGPSHMSMLTGLQPDRVVGHGVTSNGILLPDGIPTLATVLDRAGYQTGAVIGGLPLARELSGLERGFHYYNDIFEDRINTVLFSGFLRSTTVFRVAQRILRFTGFVFPYLQKSGNIVTDQAIGWLGDNSEKPFFLFVHYYDTHGPYDPPEPFDTMYSPDEALRQQSAPHPFIFKDWVTNPPASSQALADRRALYRGEVTHVDTEIGRIIDWGEKRKLWDNTLLIITADHGEGFDSDYIGHINRLYESIVRIPMIVHDPRSNEVSQLRSGRLVNVSDVFFTALAFLDIKPPDSAAVAVAKSPGSIDNWDHDLTDIRRTGKSTDGHHFGWDFVAMLTHGAPSPADVDIGRLFALRFPDWILIYGPDAYPYYEEYTCFDLATDPGETVNVYCTWDWNIKEHIMVPQALTEWASTQSLDKSDAHPENTAQNPNSQLSDSLRALGYLQ